MQHVIATLMVPLGTATGYLAHVCVLMTMFWGSCVMSVEMGTGDCHKVYLVCHVTAVVMAPTVRYVIR